MAILDRLPFFRRQQPARSASRARASRTPHSAIHIRSILAAEKTGRLESTWATTPEEIDSFIYSHWRKIVARARNEARGGDHARKFLQLCRDNIAGPTGFTLQSQITYPDGNPDKDAGDAIIDAYAEWSRRENFSVNGLLSRAAFERLAVTCWARDGEFIAIIRRGPDVGPWGIALQVIDPLRLDPTHCEQLTDGRFIKHGIEFNALGRPLRYHFTKEPPGAQLWQTTYTLAGERDIIPAADVVHVFFPEFAGQKRGLSPMISALARMRVLQNYEDAALVNADIGARKAGFFKDPEANNDDLPPEDLPMDSEAGVFENIGNREFIPFDPQYPSNEYDPFTKSALRAIACGLNVSYNNLASDLTSVNFSSIRQGALDEREVWKGLQHGFIETLNEPTFRPWLAHSLLAARIKIGNTPLNPALLAKYQSCIFTGRRWGWIDPASEIAAAEKSIALKIKSRSQVIREYGGDPWSVWQEIQSEEADMVSLGIDPKITVAGAAPMPALAAQDGNDKEK